MANRNASLVLSSLGFPIDFYNQPAIAIREMWAACVRFLTSDIANVVDCGIETKQSIGKGGATIIDCGLPEGRIEFRVRQIKLACEWGMENGAKGVEWA